MNNRGAILGMTLGFMGFFTLLGLGALHLAGVLGESSARYTISTQAFWLAEAGLSTATTRIRSDESNYVPVPNTLPPVSSNMGQGTVNYSWTAQTAETMQTVSNGMKAFIRNYQVSSTGTINNVSVTLTQVVQRQKIPVFQYAVFYNDDLETLPGKPMTLSGDVHSNGDIYIGADGASLTIKDYLNAVGNIYNERKDGGSLTYGPVSILNKQTNQYELMNRSGETPLDSNRADWATASQQRWGGSVKSGVNGVVTLELPPVSSTQPDGFYAQNAGLKIVGTTAYVNGVPTNLPSGTISQSTFYDARERKNVTVTNVDVEKLNGSGSFPANGLVYATRTEASSSQPNGIRLINGSTLNGGLTVVSNDPVYLQGDYNSANKKPAAIISDAVTILSSNFGSGNPPPAATTTNAAFIAGIKPTAGSKYSGGFENYLRFLENWSGKTLNVVGSFVEQGASQIAQGNWSTGYYSPPNRNWGFDTDFNDLGKLPPFTPQVVRVVNLTWSRN
jgi:Tfp pilus assembly protein PilX